MNLNNFITVCISVMSVSAISFSFYISERTVNILEINRRDMNRLLSDVVRYIDNSNEVIGKNEIQSFTLDETNILVYRFSEDMCDGCILQDLTELYNIQKSLGKNKILILPAYENNRYNMMLLKNKLSNFRFTNISEEFLEFPSSRTTGLSQRFFAYVNNQGRMTSFYFPSKNQQDITRLYLNHLKEKIQKNNKNKIVGHK